MEGEIRFESSPEKKKESYTREALQNRIDSVRDERYSEDFETLPFKEAQILEDMRIREFKGLLLSEKEKFKHVFETEHGSVYFVLADGSSFRIKSPSLTGGSGLYESMSMSPILPHIIFLTPEVAKSVLIDLDILAFRKESYVIETVACSVGSSPLEFGPFKGSVGTRDMVRNEGSRVILSGYTDPRDRDEPFNGYPFHIGHPIVKIY